ncbi:IS110 family transposase [Paenibacillus thiaminolyticus]|uniref:IS110 family transposase n=1 Tax=Paenibacillus thiaminolyticus TaxID=49283 RepID=UPI00232EB7D7|nr:IS110 family transposase [Paenibacillus thiaminolyticus]WCF06101.1 IS110 family transposase [Paenibacillus thiaminolyticus]
MKPVIGIDVAKGMSVVQCFLKRNLPIGRAETILHTPKGFERLKALLTKLEQQAGFKPQIILEPTGHYHRVLVQYLQREEYQVILVNPLQAQRARRTGLRKVKTDESDAWHLGDLYYQEEAWLAHPIKDEALTDLQFLTRQHEFVTSLYVQAKLNMRALIDQFIPGYENVFKDLFSKTSLNLLEECLSPAGIQEQGDNWYEAIKKATRASRSDVWMNKKVELMRAVCEENPVTAIGFGLRQSLLTMLNILRGLQEQLVDLDRIIYEVSQTIPQVQLLESIPGVSTKLATVIVAEIGDVSQFSHPGQVVAMAGLDPSVFSSGKFTASENKITKRGSKRLRRAAYLAVICGLRKGLNPRLREYYDKKKSEGKPHKVAVIACANKVLHHVYAMLKKGQPFAF